MAKTTNHDQIQDMKIKELSLENGKASNPQKGVPLGHVRATLNVPEDILEKLKDLAYWERVSLKEIMIASFKKLLSSCKEIKPRPKEKKSEVLESL